MEDEFEDRLIYQFFVSHWKHFSKLAMGFSINTSYAGYAWRMLRIYVLKREVLIMSLFFLLLLLYIQFIDLYTRLLLPKLKSSFATSRQKRRPFGSVFDSNLRWEYTAGNIGVYAIQGRRPHMEDRFVVKENITDTGVSLFAVFDGHGGEFAAEYATENLISSLRSRLIEIKAISEDSSYVVTPRPPLPAQVVNEQSATKNNQSPKKRRGVLKKTLSEADDTTLDQDSELVDVDLVQMLEKLLPVRKTMKLASKPTSVVPVAPPESHTYLEKGIVNYSKLLTDEVLATDRLLLENARKHTNIAGTTALIALVEGSRLIVANVGDSRGVMCDSKGNTIPLSFDHKPEQMREKRRIQEAGGFISFNGVWRVAGILATSRALGDYPLKDRKLIIADPDILTFDLSNHKPQFLIFASDGLWDTFTNEEAVSFIKQHINEPFHGAQSITMQAYNKGSMDNITVIIINLVGHDWSDTSAKVISSLSDI